MEDKEIKKEIKTIREHLENLSALMKVLLSQFFDFGDEEESSLKKEEKNLSFKPKVKPLNKEVFYAG